MLPQELSDTYRKYKEDTNIFATWLCSNALICGYQLPVAETPLAAAAASGSNTQAHNKQLAEHSTEKTPLPVKELVAQAKLISETKKPLVKVPRIIQNILARAIERRKKCSNWFERLGGSNISKSLEESNIQHQYFINVLEEIQDLLHPHFEAAGARKPSPPRPAAGLFDDSKNRFEDLYTEDLAYGDLDTEAPKDAEASEALPSIVELTTPPEAFELDQPDEAIDTTFIVYCFLEDLHNKQEFLKTVWQDYAEKKLDLRTAALVTNVACQLVDVKEIELLEVLPRDSKRPDFDIILDEIIPEKDGELRDVDLEMCDRTYFYEDESYNKYKNMLWNRESEDTLPSIKQLASIHPDAVKLMHDHDRLLSQMWLDLHIKHQGEQCEGREMRPQEPIPGAISLPFLDEITGGLDNVHIDSEWSSFPAAFKARVCLNINDILGNDASKAYEMLRHQAALANAAISIICDSGREPKLPPVAELKPIWGTEEVAEMAIGCAMMIKNVFIETFHIKRKLSVVDAGSVQRAQTALEGPQTTKSGHLKIHSSSKTTTQCTAEWNGCA